VFTSRPSKTSKSRTVAIANPWQRVKQIQSHKSPRKVDRFTVLAMTGFLRSPIGLPRSGRATTSNIPFFEQRV
jgi:hypothetical protein